MTSSSQSLSAHSEYTNKVSMNFHTFKDECATALNKLSPASLLLSLHSYSLNTCLTEVVCLPWHLQMSLGLRAFCPGISSLGAQRRAERSHLGYDEHAFETQSHLLQECKVQ